ELKASPVKWTDGDKFHLTIRFLGSLRTDIIEELIARLGEIKTGFNKLKFHTSGTGFFPNAKNPNVVFVDLNEDGNNSGKLVEEIDKVIETYGIKPDKKFVPHITLGRFKHERKERLPGNINIHFESFEIEFNSF